MTKSVIQCPECDYKIELIPVRKPQEEGVTTMTMNLTQATTITGPFYAATSKTYKCTNPKCWVTKVELSW